MEDLNWHVLQDSLKVVGFMKRRPIIITSIDTCPGCIT